MALNRLFLFALLSAVGLLVHPVQGRAMQEGRNMQGGNFVTGGIASEERDILDKRRQEFNVWVMTAAKGSGAYLADVRIRVADSTGTTVLDTTLDGPILLANLKPGRYAVTASLDEQKQTQSTAIRAGERRELYFYFEVAADTAPPEADSKAAAGRKPAK